MKLTEIKLHRLKAGILQIELAQKAGINRCRLSEIENGHIAPKAEEIARLSSALSVPASELVPS